MPVVEESKMFIKFGAEYFHQYEENENWSEDEKIKFRSATMNPVPYI